MLKEHELKRLERVIFTELGPPGKPGQINPACIGKDAGVILREIGIRADGDIRLVVAEVPSEHNLVWTEQMMPVMPVARVPTVEQAIDLAVRSEHGFRHTASIHSTNVDAITRMARAMNCTIFVANGPNFAGLGEGGEGFTSFSIAVADRRRPHPAADVLARAAHHRRRRAADRLMEPAIGLLEFESIARGIEAGDAMAKRSPLDVHPGGDRASGQVPGAGRRAHGGRRGGPGRRARDGRRRRRRTRCSCRTCTPTWWRRSAGRRSEDDGEALGVVETMTVAGVDPTRPTPGVKAARVAIRELRLADDLGGKGYVLFGGEVAEVEAAVEAASARVGGVRAGGRPSVIAQLHGEMRENLTPTPTSPSAAGDVEGARRAVARRLPRSRPIAPGTGGPLAEARARRAPAAKRRRPGDDGEARIEDAARHAEGAEVQLARVIGTVVATVKADGSRA